MLNNNPQVDNAKGVFAQSDWIQPSIGRSYLPLGNERIIDGVYAATSSQQIVIRTESSSTWFWTKEWQELEREADNDIAHGRFTSHDSMDEFIADLDS